MKTLLDRVSRQRVLLLVCVVAVAVHGFVIAHRRVHHLGDFDISREFGRRFLAGEYLYEGGLHYPYMPIAAMYFSPLALLDPTVGFALRYMTAILCVWLTFRLLNRMTPRQSSSEWCAVVTLLLMSHYIIRDLDDGGPHLILLAMVVGGIYCVRQGRQRSAAMWFGLAVALKATAALFVPFFIWKRQWRLALATAIAIGCWIVLPMVWMGPLNWWNHQREWTLVAAGSFLGEKSAGALLNEERVQNQSLASAVMRYLVRYPEGHPLRLSHPGYISGLNLRPNTASLLTWGIMAVLVAFCCRRWRRPYQARQDPAWLTECSGVLILALLLAPVTWVQHLTWMLPALYLIVVKVRNGAGLRTPAGWALGAYAVLALLLNREFVGKETYLLLLSYHIHTLAMLLVLGILLLQGDTIPSAEPAAAGRLSCPVNKEESV
jgi:alpha-1,2-mannosyltransferase